MKKLLTLLLMLGSLSSISQIADWYKVDLSRIGYKRTTFTFENVPLSLNNHNGGSTFGETVIKGGSFEFSADIYAKNLYFSIDGSTFLDVGLTLFQFDRTKQRWFDNDAYFVLRSDILPMRLAFGSNIGKYVGLYVGGHYSLSSIGLSYKSNTSPFRDTRIGGHTYGVGGHLVAAVKFINVRYSYMYNWQSQAKLFKGHGITNELVISGGFANVGLFLKFVHVFNMTNAGYLPEDRTKLFNNKYDGADYAWQSSHYATQYQLSVGIYSAGLFSGISKIGTRALSETERGLAKERREEKRRKVIYKD